MNGIVLWTLIGISLMALEIFGVPGIGILFTGFAAITVAGTIYWDPILNDNIGSQLLYFFTYTLMWAGILWIPLNKFIRYDDSGDYTNIIGTYATVNGHMVQDVIGEIIWSGTKVRAMIDSTSNHDEFDDKTNVRISNIVDGVFYIKHSKESVA